MIPLKLGLVGAGRIARTYADVLGDCDGLEVVGVADTDPESAASVSDRLGSRAFGKHEDLVDQTGPDAVIVCTPPNTHHSITVDLLKTGVHVMCEKPLALSSTDALEMLSLADASGLTLTMASKFRYVEDVLRARSIINSGVLGGVILLENTFASRVDMTNRWNADSKIAGGGVMIDNGTHSVDIVRFLAGPISQVMALEGKRIQDLTVEDTVQVFLRSESGVRATVDLSWSINKERNWFLEVYGSEGTIQLGWEASRYRERTSREWTVFGRGYDKTQAIRDQVTNFARAIRGEEQLMITGVDALASVEVIEAAYQSLRKDDWVRVDSNSITAPLR